jgi:hypothetical protein
MIINNLSATTEQYYVRQDGGSKYLTNKLAPHSFDKVDASLLGTPPYTVSLRCNGITGIKTDDVIVSWLDATSKGIFASYANPASAVLGDDGGSQE